MADIVSGLPDMILLFSSPGFRRGIGAAEDVSIYLRLYRRLQKRICFAMCVYIINGKIKRPHLRV